jgi:ATP synthase protein I
MGFNLKDHREWAANLTIVMQLGLTMVGSIAFCFFIGRSLDRWLNTRGIFIAIFTILGVIGGAVTCYRQIQELVERDQKNRNSHDGE